MIPPISIALNSQISYQLPYLSTNKTISKFTQTDSSLAEIVTIHFKNQTINELFKDLSKSRKKLILKSNFFSLAFYVEAKNIKIYQVMDAFAAQMDCYWIRTLPSTYFFTAGSRSEDIVYGSIGRPALQERHRQGAQMIQDFYKLPKNQQYSLMNGTSFSQLDDNMKQHCRNLLKCYDEGKKTEGQLGLHEGEVENFEKGKIKITMDEQNGFTLSRLSFEGTEDSRLVISTNDYLYQKNKRQAESKEFPSSPTNPNEYHPIGGDIEKEKLKEIKELQVKISIHAKQTTFPEILKILNSRYEFNYILPDPITFPQIADIDVKSMPMHEFIIYLENIFKMIELEWRDGNILIAKSPFQSNRKNKIRDDPKLMEKFIEIIKEKRRFIGQ